VSTTGVGHGPLRRSAPWKTWWVWLWGVVAVALLVSVWFRAPFMIWTIATVVAFGGMEGFGLTHAAQGYPPLTQVIREYIPRWLAFSLIYGCAGMAGATWFRVRDRIGLAVLVGLVGWFTAHFDTAFDNAAVVQERAKYAWYADRARGVLTAPRRARHRLPPVAPDRPTPLSGADDEVSGAPRRGRGDGTRSCHPRRGHSARGRATAT